MEQAIHFLAANRCRRRLYRPGGFHVGLESARSGRRASGFMTGSITLK